MEATKSRLRASTPAAWSTWPIAWPSCPCAWSWEEACRQLGGVAVGSLALARSWKQVEKPAITWSATGAGRWAAWSWLRRPGSTAAMLGLAGQEPEEDHADDRHAEGAAELLGGRQHAGGRAGVAAADPGEDHVDQWRDREAEAETTHHQGRQELPGVDGFAVAADRGHHPEHADDQQQTAEAQDRTAEPRRQPHRHRRGDRRADRERDRGEPRVQRGEAEPDLQEQREGQEERGHSRKEHDVQQQAAHKRPLPEQAEHHQRRVVLAGLAPLVQHKQREQRY